MLNNTAAKNWSVVTGGATQLDRNNTNFIIKLFEFFKKAKWGTEYDFLKYYQNVVRVFTTDINIDARGLLIYHGMGLGKSILSIAIAMDMIKTRQPIMLLSKSLQENMRESIHKYINLRKGSEPNYHLARLNTMEVNQWIDRNFSFVSMNASNMLQQMGKAAEGRSNVEFDKVLEKQFGEVLKIASMDGKLLIVDEAHNLFRAITNGSKNAQGLYNMVMKAKNLKIMFLTGTPIANNPFELVSCFNMLGSAVGKKILPEIYKDFNSLFVDDVNGRIKNKEKFQNRILGLVSHVSNESTVGKAFNVEKGTMAEFPEEKPIVVERVNMDPDQFVMYQLARDKEVEEGGTGSGGQFKAPAQVAMTKPKSMASSTYRVKSRQLSNYSAPAGYHSEKDPNKIPAADATSAKFRVIYDNVLKHNNQLGLVYSQFTGVGGLGTFMMFLKSKGWNQVTAQNTPDVSGGYDIGFGSGLPSADAYLANIDAEFAKGAYGEPEEVMGGYMKDPGCDSYDITSAFIGGAEDESPAEESPVAEKKEPPVGKSRGRAKTFAIISGAINIQDRSKLQSTYNDPDNKRGGIIDLILISSTGAEGLDLKNVRHIHVMEPYWNWGRISQVIARGVRNNSHILLPASEKNVTPYIYLAIPPESERGHDGIFQPTTDIELYDKSRISQLTIESFNEALREVSIECLVNEGVNCKTCRPTNAPLYTDDPERDIRARDPCGEMKESQIKATEVMVDDKQYYYVADSASIYDYKIFVYDDDINGYRQMSETEAGFAKIASAITVAVAEDAKVPVKKKNKD